ncbi:MAG: hypothetical protein ACTSQD_03705 [Promethearchaeota archaeon]
MNSAPGSVQRLIYSTASTTLGNFFENSTKAGQSIISAILIPHLQTAIKILTSSSF